MASREVWMSSGTSPNGSSSVWRMDARIPSHLPFVPALALPFDDTLGDPL